MSLKTFSIIIPMYNSEDFIEKCLDSIFNSDYPVSLIEVIVVDNNSNDNSINIVKKYPIKLLSCPVGNISKVRNTGAKEAKGDILYFIDSDCVIESEHLLRAKKIFNEKNIVAAGSGYKLPHSSSWIEKAWLLESKIFERYVSFIPAGNFFILKKIFIEIGGFNESLETCEDADICERISNIGMKIINSKSLESIHLRNPKTIINFINKEIWYGQNMIASIKNNIYDKVFWVTIFIYLSHLFLFIGMLFNNTILIFIFLFCILFFVFISVLHHLYISRKFKYIIHLVLLYYLYFISRGFGIFKNYFLKR